ncbi:MAG: murein biosynthesis integral membrane protein MurJ [Chloroflexi bacterium]|nr:murein biosynthesis integral membrane protein MurJ [Chloroflexota bacterium]
MVELTGVTGAPSSEPPLGDGIPGVAPVREEAGAVAGLVRAAGINSLGNVASRALGLVRESVIAGIFGASGATSAFDAVSGVPKMVYELLIGGMLSAALVPVLSEYAGADRRELDEALSTLLSLAVVVLLAVVLVLELAAPWIAPLLVGGFDAELLATATVLARIIVPAILIYGFSGILQAYHYARRRFVYPAIGAPAHNLGVIMAVVLLAGKLNIASLSVGILVASVCQLLVQLPGLRGARLRVRLHWRHPVVRRILSLYAPVVLSIVVQNVGIVIDRNLASRTVNEAITWMTKATFLVQLPLGLVSMAISLAVLPVLSQIDAALDLHRFKRTFSRGLRLVLVVIVPATALLFSLGPAIIRLIFQRGEFTPEDAVQTWRALRLYLIGLPFAAIDLPLVFAFYAQKDTVTPVVVGIVAVLVYLVVGPTLAFLAGWGFLGLVLANSVQLAGHAVIMLICFKRRFDGLRGYGMVSTSLKALVASLPVALGGWLVRALVEPRLGGFIGDLLVVGLALVVGAVAYLAAARLLVMEELDLLWENLRHRLGSA